MSGQATATRRAAIVPGEAPDFVQQVTAMMLAGNGDRLPSRRSRSTAPGRPARRSGRSATSPPKSPSGTRRSASSATSARSSVRTPPSARRSSTRSCSTTRRRPSSPTRFRGADFEGWRYTIQVAPEDCTGCTLCVEFCPAKDKSNPRHKAHRHGAAARRSASGARELRLLPRPARGRPVEHPRHGRQGLAVPASRSSSTRAPARAAARRRTSSCSRSSSATGRSSPTPRAARSIYGGNLPTTPYTTNRDGRGPAWSNSLFEDNAEFGLGMRLAARQPRRAGAAAARRGRLREHRGRAGRRDPRRRDQSTRPASRRSASACSSCARSSRRSTTPRRPHARRNSADDLVKKSVWIVGGDGWAYDIGFGGLDHVLASGANVNILVLDTEVYSNTGGQQSKATPLGAAAKFAVGGKETGKKDLGTDGHDLRQRLRRADRLRREGPPDRQSASSRPRRIRARRSSSPTATASRTATTWPRLRPAEARRSTPASGRSTGSTRAASSRRGAARSSTRARRRSAVERTATTRPGSACSRRLTPQRSTARRARRQRGRAAAATLQAPVGRARQLRRRSRPAAEDRRRRGARAVDLSTTYLGLELPHPFMPGASPLADDLDIGAPPRGRRRRRDRHALALRGADRRRRARARYRAPFRGASRFAEARSYLPEPRDLRARHRTTTSSTSHA